MTCPGCGAPDDQGCRKGCPETKAPTSMLRVIVESPYAGDVEANLRYARAAVRDCLNRGEAPYASHLFFTQPELLDDDDPDQRRLGIEAGLTWGTVAEKTVVYQDLGITAGMRVGITRAQQQRRPVEYRHLYVSQHPLSRKSDV